MDVLMVDYLGYSWVVQMDDLKVDYLEHCLDYSLVVQMDVLMVD
jgi:hypothetical protein